MSLVFAYIAAISAFIGILLILLGGRSSPRPFGQTGKLPLTLELIDVVQSEIPGDARAPLDYLIAKLSSMGFKMVELPIRVPGFHRAGPRVHIVPFVNPDERTYFLMGIRGSLEGILNPKSQIMLHIITPMLRGGRVETTTLEVLGSLAKPEQVDVRIVLDAETVEEIWSRHRRALTEYRRDERSEITSEGWREHAAAAYQAWIQSAVRAHRLQLDPEGRMYRVRSRPKSVI